MADFAGETRRPDLHPPVEHEATADAGPQGHHDDVVIPASGPDPVLGQDGEVGVVLNEHGPSRQLVADQLVPVHALGLGEVRGEAEPPLAIDHAGRADAHRHQRRGREHPVQVGDHLRHRGGHVAADNVAGPPGGGHPGLGDDVTGAAEGDAQDLGPADIDAVGDVGGRGAPVGRHEVDSTRAFSSRMAVAMMRLVARIFMKPGMGTRSSASRWYVTFVPPPSAGSKM